MTYSSLTTEVRPTFQQSSRGYAIDRIVLHHCATTDMNGVLSMMTSGSREVSANYVVKDNRIASVVPEEMRSWSLSSAQWDGRSITFEIANDSVGGSWPVSTASHESVARMVADISNRYGIPINRDTVLGHSEVYSRYGASYSTACPGGLDIDWIVRRALEIGNPTSTGEEEMKYFVESSNGGPSGTKLNGVLFGPGIVERTKFGTGADFIAKAAYEVPNRFISTKQVEDLKGLLVTSAVDVDEAALGAIIVNGLKGSLGGLVTETDLDAAVKEIVAGIRVPTKITATLS